MLGCYDFCGHYEWTFEWMSQRGGEPLLREYWDEAIHRDSQRHAIELIGSKGIEGMKEYWGHTLVDEGAGYHCTATDTVFRTDMHECPSKGFLIRNGLHQHHDYCDHCMGWIGPLLKECGWVVDHEHNHCGQCWWELRRATDPTRPGKPGELSGEHDVRKSAGWLPPHGTMDVYERANAPQDKKTRKMD